LNCDDPEGAQRQREHRGAEAGITWSSKRHSHQLNGLSRWSRHRARKLARMASVAFDQFLVQNKSRTIKMDGKIVAIFERVVPVIDEHLNAAEQRLGVPLPASYKTFLRVCGSGRWCGDFVVPPEDVYAFDQECSDMAGFVALVHNVGGIGDFVAMNPREATAAGEWTLYHCSHDPFGSRKIADSFEAWTRDALADFERG
jgi:hypothetical protein